MTCTDRQHETLSYLFGLLARDEEEEFEFCLYEYDESVEKAYFIKDTLDGFEDEDPPGLLVKRTMNKIFDRQKALHCKVF